MLGANVIDGAKPVHLLWALMLLKLYCAEAVLCTLAGGVHEQTFRKWAWRFVNEISELQYGVVSGQSDHVNVPLVDSLV
jgi:hypothetical protein